MNDITYTSASSQTQDRSDRGPPHSVPSLQKRLSEVLAEYETKLRDIDEQVAAFENAGDNLKSAACIMGLILNGSL